MFGYILGTAIFAEVIFIVMILNEIFKGRNENE